MAGFREFLEKQQQSLSKKASHPKYSHWEHVVSSYRKQGLCPFVELFRPEDVLGYQPAKLYLKVKDKSGTTIFSDVDDWDVDLDQGLVSLGVRAVDKKNESQRYNLLIEVEFTKIENRYGDGFFKSVLVQYVREVGHDSPPLQQILKYSTALLPNRDSVNYTPCREWLESVIANKARELNAVLQYNLDDITDILTGALVQNLDERFSIGNRRKMGLLE